MVRRQEELLGALKDPFEGGSFQEFIDNSFSGQNGLRTPGFAWAPFTQVGFTYEQIEAELGIKTMATYVDVNSPAPMKSVEGISLNSGKIPRFKQAYPVDENIIRERMMLASSMPGKVTANMQNVILKQLFLSVEDLILGNYNTLTYQRDQMVSKGALTLSDRDNPRGLQNITFSAGVPEENKTVLSGNYRWFTNDSGTEGSTSDPVADLKKMVKTAKNKGMRAFHFEVEETTFDKTLTHSKVAKWLGWGYSPVAPESNAIEIGRAMSSDAAKAMLERVIGAPITINKEVVSVEKFDKTTKKVIKEQMPSFAENTWVLVPDGALGEIKAVIPILAGTPSNGDVAYYDGGRTMIKRMFNLDTNTMVVESECTALVVPNKPKYMFYLTIQ